jgi:hypothetical protein
LFKGAWKKSAENYQEIVDNIKYIGGFRLIVEIYQKMVYYGVKI